MKKIQLQIKNITFASFNVHEFCKNKGSGTFVYDFFL